MGVVMLYLFISSDAKCIQSSIKSENRGAILNDFTLMRISEFFSH